MRKMKREMCRKMTGRTREDFLMRRHTRISGRGVPGRGNREDSGVGTSLAVSRSGKRSYSTSPETGCIYMLHVNVNT
jgi:hypothetical protein